MKCSDAIDTIKANYPPENYSTLRDALDLAIVVLQEKADRETSN